MLKTTLSQPISWDISTHSQCLGIYAENRLLVGSTAQQNEHLTPRGIHTCPVTSSNLDCFVGAGFTRVLKASLGSCPGPHSCSCLCHTVIPRLLPAQTCIHPLSSGRCELAHLFSYLSIDECSTLRCAQGFATKTRLQLTFFLHVPVCFPGDNGSTGDNHFPSLSHGFPLGRCRKAQTGSVPDIQ